MMLDQQFIDEASHLFKEKERLTQYTRVSKGQGWLELRIIGCNAALTNRDSLLSTMLPEDFAHLVELRLEEIDERLQEMGIQA